MGMFSPLDTFLFFWQRHWYLYCFFLFFIFFLELFDAVKGPIPKQKNLFKGMNFLLTYTEKSTEQKLLDKKMIQEFSSESSTNISYSDIGKWYNYFSHYYWCLYYFNLKGFNFLDFNFTVQILHI